MERSKKELSEFNQRAMDRFDYDKTGIQPVGLPDDPSGAKSFSFQWVCNPVPLSDEEKMAEFVVRKGEFGWLDDDRVDEIAVFAEKLSISKDQGLSLRSALLQQKPSMAIVQCKIEADKSIVITSRGWVWSNYQKNTTSLQ